MAIPDYQTLMLPVLRILQDRHPRHVRELTDALANEFNLTDHERGQLTPGGGSLLFHGRVGWAKTYLSQAGLLDQVSRGVHRISESGLRVLGTDLARIDNDFLMQFDGFQNFRARSGTRSVRDTHATEADADDRQTDPTERLNTAYGEIRTALAIDLLDQVKHASPGFFENLVVDLLVAMGYGGSRQDAGQAVGGSGDDGIDGIIKEDRLGLDVVYIQAKRWENPVTRPMVQAFTGSLEGNRARKGVFITTSRFTADAREYVNRIEKRIVLIDGEQLARYMIDFGIGVTDVTTLYIRRIDQDYFDV